MNGIFEPLINLALNLIGTFGYLGVSIGTAFFPSEMIMPFAGIAVFQGKMTLWGITVAAALGDVLGSLIVYFVAYKGGRPLVEKYGKYVFIGHSELDQADRWFERYGHEAVLISKLLPLMGRFISLPAGITRMNLKKFIIYTFLGSLPFAFVLGYLGVKLGQNWHITTGYFHIFDVIVVIGIIGTLTYIIYKKKQNKTTKQTLKLIYVIT